MSECAEPRAGACRMSGSDRREQLLDVALALFGRHGFDGTTVRDIAAAANVTDGLIYRYFASKEELLAEVIERARRVFNSLHLDSLASEPSFDGLLRVLRDLTNFQHTNIALIDLIWYESCRGSDTGRQFQVLREELIRQLQTALATWQAQGLLTDEDPVRVARMIAGQTFAFAVANRCLSEADWEVDMTAFMTTVARVMVEGLRPR